ncbi:hypothetical protein OIU84_017241 [Salix udensis]|uniref:chitinase n=1 Tax=Salix udensis TaxID=889485 RepID=A0AAD6PKC7_9ROSI|nr:hypothetical protein OIU84_017241 [Salix udensis]
MAPSVRKNQLLIVLLGVLIAGAAPSYVVAQNCGCAAAECCSRWGYCGTGDDYCGTGCQGGPCTPAAPTNDVSVPDIVTPEFFGGILDQAASSCAGKNFYSRDAFLEALNSYSRFGRVGSVDDSRREIAAFFAHVTHETGHFCYIEEIDGPSKDYCDEGQHTVSMQCCQGFGATIRAINGALECDGANPATVQARVGYYTDYCNQLGVAPGDNLTC